MPRDETLASVRADTREDEMPPAALPDDDPNRAEYVSERLERTERTEVKSAVGKWGRLKAMPTAETERVYCLARDRMGCGARCRTRVWGASVAESTGWDPDMTTSCRRIWTA